MLLWPDVMNEFHRIHELTFWCLYQKLCAFSELFFWGRSHELGNRDSQNIKIILLRITQRDVFEHWSHQLCPLVPHLGSDLEPRWNLEVISRLEGHSFSHTPWFAHRPCRLLWDSHVLVAEKPQGTKWEREDVVTWWWDTYAQCLQERSRSVTAGREDRMQGQRCLIYLKHLCTLRLCSSSHCCHIGILRIRKWGG